MTAISSKHISNNLDDTTTKTKTIAGDDFSDKRDFFSESDMSNQKYPVHINVSINLTSLT